MTLNTYGPPRKYGAIKYGPSTTTGLLWGLLIDWDGDGIYDPGNYASLMVSCKVTRGRRNYLKSDNKGFEPMEEGLLSVVLDNSDGRFDALNISSPLYPYVRPGVNIALYVRIPGEATKRSVFTGKISDITPVSGGTYEKVTISAKDGVKWLKDQEVTKSTEVDWSVDYAIGQILDLAEYPWSVDLESSSDIISYFWAWQTISAWNLIHILTDGSLGTFFIAADGTAKLYDRNRLSSPSLVIDQSDMLKEIITKQPWNVIKNNIEVRGFLRTELDSNVDLWQLSGKPAIAASGGTFTVEARFTYNGASVPVRTFLTPVAITDFLVNSAADGSGTNLTASCTITFSNPRGEQITATVTNNSGTNGYITLLKIRGKPLEATEVSMVEEDAASKALFGPKNFLIESQYLQNANYIEQSAAMLALMLTSKKIFPTVQFVNQPDIQFVMDLFDIATLQIPKKGINDDYRVSYIEHNWLSDNGQEVLTRMSFEEADTFASDVWRFTTELGISSKFAF